MNTSPSIDPTLEQSPSVDKRLEVANRLIHSMFVDRATISTGMASEETTQMYDQLHDAGVNDLQDAIQTLAEKVVNQKATLALYRFFQAIDSKEIPIEFLQDIAICTDGVKSYVWIAVDTDTPQGENAEMEVLRASSRANQHGTYLSVQVVDAGVYEVPSGYHPLVTKGKPVGD